MGHDEIGMGQGIDLLERMASDLAGKIEEVGALPDGSGFAVMSMPLPATHWIYSREFPGKYGEDPPAALRLGLGESGTYTFTREDLAHHIAAAARYAIRGATANGSEKDFDPDALVQNMVVGLLGYHTSDGLSHLDDGAEVLDD